MALHWRGSPQRHVSDDRNPPIYLAPELALLVQGLDRAIHTLTAEYGPLYTWADRRLVRSLMTQATGLADVPEPTLHRAERLLTDAQSVADDATRARLHAEVVRIRRVVGRR